MRALERVGDVLEAHLYGWRAFAVFLVGFGIGFAMLAVRFSALLFFAQFVLCVVLLLAFVAPLVRQKGLTALFDPATLFRGDIIRRAWRVGSGAIGVMLPEHILSIVEIFGSLSRFEGAA